MSQAVLVWLKKKSTRHEETLEWGYHSSVHTCVRVCTWSVWRWDVCHHRGPSLTSQLVCHTVKPVNDLPQACNTDTPALSAVLQHEPALAPFRMSHPVLPSLLLHLSSFVTMRSCEALSWGGQWLDSLTLKWTSHRRGREKLKQTSDSDWPRDLDGVEKFNVVLVFAYACVSVRQSVDEN